MNEIVFLIWDNKHEAWWKEDGLGYTTAVAEAGRFSPNTASSIVMEGAFAGQLSQARCPVAAPENWSAAE